MGDSKLLINKHNDVLIDRHGEALPCTETICKVIYQIFPTHISAYLESIKPETCDWSKQWTRFNGYDVLGFWGDLDDKTHEFLRYLFAWSMCDNGYDIPEIPVKYVPFTKETFKPHRDKWLIDTRDGNVERCGWYCDRTLLLGKCGHTYKELFQRFTFEDGSPCGQLVE